MKTFSILIVDDHPVVRRGLKQLVESEEDLQVCGEVGDAGAAHVALEELEPDLILLDLNLEGMGGIDLTKQVRSGHPDLPVLVVSMYEEALYAERALHAGARGYIMKRAPDDEIIQAVRHVLDGKIYVSEKVSSKLFPLEAGTATLEDASPVDRLSDRELEVFLMLGKGYAPRHIAEELCVSVKTVESHRRRIKEKLNVEDASELTRFAVQWNKERDTEV